MKLINKLAEMTIDGLDAGFNIKNIIETLRLSDKDLNLIKILYPEVKLKIRIGQLAHYLTCYDMVKAGKMKASLFIFMTKTMWRDFYPQESDKPELDQSAVDAHSAAIKRAVCHHLGGGLNGRLIVSNPPRKVDALTVKSRDVA